jgi:hypothetical protein
VAVSRREGQGEADFIVTRPDRSRLACEIGYGRKSADQTRTTMSSVQCSYGLVIAENDLAIEGDVVFVPKRFFLTV